MVRKPKGSHWVSVNYYNKVIIHAKINGRATVNLKKYKIIALIIYINKAGKRTERTTKKT